MKVTGIIAEYNPFHKGHQYHIQQARKDTNADFCIVVMSGCFTQRGEPALLDKYLRTEMALQCGADLVLELPSCYACSSAPYFAQGAVSLLDKLGVVTALSFGSECGRVSLLHKAAQILENEPPSYEKALKAYLRSGLSYPAAQSQALVDHMGQQCFSKTELSSLLSAPNDILGIHYCKALLSRQSTIQPAAVARWGSPYSDPSLHTINSSALAIRTALYEQSELSCIQNQVPDCVYALLEKHYQKTFPIFPAALSSMLHYKLLCEAEDGFSDYLDVSKELSDRICNKLYEYTDFSSFCALLKTKELTYSRISRALLHILLNLKKEDLENYCEKDYVFYGRILGFRQSSASLLTAIKANGSIPLISKLADAHNYLGADAIKQLHSDIQAAHIYNALVQQCYRTMLPTEKARQIILR